jgi:hypothetical protein
MMRLVAGMARQPLWRSLTPPLGWAPGSRTDSVARRRIDRLRSPRCKPWCSTSTSWSGSKASGPRRALGGRDRDPVTTTANVLHERMLLPSRSSLSTAPQTACLKRHVQAESPRVVRQEVNEQAQGQTVACSGGPLTSALS